MLEKIKGSINKGLLSASVNSSTFFEIEKIKGKAEKEKSEIKQLFSELGKQVYELWKADHFDPTVINSICERVQGKELTLDTYQKEIEHLEAERSRVLREANMQAEKSSASCPVCGATNTMGGKFCVHCGALLPDFSSNPKCGTKKICSCGATNSQSAKFCISCGKSLLEEEKE
ncbi:hypothetical protein KE531_00160 [Eubacteriaceae bacterium Marseille-Q4139]|nr:hypothetical protein [Eubacteriaceae bacterium Marseille-Q4139]